MNTEQLSFDLKEKKTLIAIARKALEDYAAGRTQEAPEPSQLPKSLLMACGVFVSLYYKKKLRGCVGHFQASSPLFQTVYEMAIVTATKDTRFKPVKASEVNGISIELSVLSPLKRISKPEEIELGTHGIYIKKGFNTGTYLPQVAEREDWSAIDFIEHCAQYKAGLKPGEWQKAELYTYTALVIKENDVS